jgi:hypothetical protein
VSASVIGCENVCEHIVYSDEDDSDEEYCDCREDVNEDEEGRPDGE